MLGVWNDVQKKRRVDELPASERKQLDTLNKSMSGLGDKLNSNKDEIKMFKEQITEHINTLVNTYEDRMVVLKNDIDYKLDNVNANP